MAQNPHEGTSFDDFLKADGIYEACTLIAVKRVLAWEIQKAMDEQNLTKTAMAKRMATSRSQLDRLLNPEKTGVSLETIGRAAAVIGRQLQIQLV